MTDIRLCKADICALASVVMMAKLRSTSPPGERQPSQIPAKANGSPSARAMAPGT
ncbi:MAG: hypothetical protein QOF70_6576, partial [Acetobacteraceae bacterium]|nr:hypothetical protein [Acetobacteraceae bacterium]